MRIASWYEKSELTEVGSVFILKIFCDVVKIK